MEHEAMGSLRSLRNVGANFDGFIVTPDIEGLRRSRIDAADRDRSLAVEHTGTGKKFVGCVTLPRRRRPPVRVTIVRLSAY